MKGFRLKIGNGKCINIDRDSWIDKEGNRISINISDNLKGMKVKCIIDDMNNWLEDKINENFNQSEAKEILNMSLASTESKDEII